VILRHADKPRVRQSSAAMAPHCWIFVNSASPDYHGSLHLSVEQARTLVAGLQEWLDHVSEG
jgi:hypothetical protein